MEKSHPIELSAPLTVNGHKVTHVVIGKHYREKHAAHMTDELVLDLVQALDGKNFVSDSTSKGIEYYAADIEASFATKKIKLYRLVWLFEGTFLEVIGVINAYRIKKRRN